METRLRALIETSEGCSITAYTPSRNGGRETTIGTLSSHVPEEIICAAGFRPHRIVGYSTGNPSTASVYWPASTEGSYARILDSILAGNPLSFDGVIGTDESDSQRRCLDIAAHLNMVPFCHLLHVPFLDNDAACEAFAREIRGLIAILEGTFRISVNEDALKSAIDLYNSARKLVGELYELRKSDTPPLSGSEFLGITRAFFAMSKRKYVEELEALMPYLRERRQSDTDRKPRLLVTSDYAVDVEFLRAIEQEGALVAMDDCDMGSRYFWQSVDTSMDPVDALATYYVKRPSSPMKFSWDGRVNEIIEWTRAYRLDGVISITEMYDYPREFAEPYLRQKLAEAGIPLISISPEGGTALSGQLRTRIAAFIEMLD